MVLGATDAGVTHAWFVDGPVERAIEGIAAGAGVAAAVERRATPITDALAGELEEYFRGGRVEFTVPLAARGTAFQRRVWGELLRIPHGATTTYGAIARRLGDAGASRAVGAANGANPIAVVVPCHRVIDSQGGLHGYAGGLHRKRFLLDLEGSGATLFAPAGA
ncbi:MAG: methylated-DNA--[protein]-cysteine S-methyltransferase [Phycisphaeraceae bacterium]|nr:methylated-DNA--[protein]-cysteine S-methyltransferase [Phycisphaeraceae bacterium]